MDTRTYQRMLVALGVAGALTALALLLNSSLAGGSQETFETVRSVDEYADLLRTRASSMRLSFALDYVFIVLYTAFFFLLGILLKERADRSIVNLALGAILLTALLDAVENAHILTLLAQAEMGLPIQASELGWQMAASQVKFVSSYSSIFLIGLVFPRENLLEKLAAWAFVYLQLPLGVLIFTAPHEWTATLVLMRAVFFIAGFLIVAKIYWDRSRHS
ncbi:MAG: hypothetical protein AB1750_14820 [Chloroflexota bacterium]